jgi:hypothetical protein
MERAKPLSLCTQHQEKVVMTTIIKKDDLLMTFLLSGK